MAEIIYDDESGAVGTEIFGCSFKSISAQMGFNSQPIIFTVTVIEENDQDFTLDMDDVRSVQQISFGELGLLGIVQHWEKTTIDPNGTGTYVVKLTDCRSVLDSINITNVQSDVSGELLSYVTQAAIISFTPSGCTKTKRIRKTIPLPGIDYSDDYDSFATIIERVEDTSITYGNNIFEVNLNELSNLTNALGEGASIYFPEGKIKSLTSTINEFCIMVGAEWWVESRRKSVTDDTIIIKIKVIRRLDGLDNPSAIDMDALVALHDGNVIRRSEGYENSDSVTNRVIWGGVKRKLHKAHAVEIKQFWGIDEQGQPLLNPSYVAPGDSPGHRIPTNISTIEKAINGDLTGEMDIDQLAVLQRYGDKYWGRRFYFELNKNDVSKRTRDSYEYIAFFQSGESIIIRAYTIADAQEYANNFALELVLESIEDRQDRLPDAHVYDITDTGEDLPKYPEIISTGWWEEDIHPQGARQFSIDNLRKLTTGDGRWGPFVRLRSIFKLEDLYPGEADAYTQYATYAELNSQQWDDWISRISRVKWTQAVLNSSNIISHNGEYYMKCTLEQYGRYVILVLPVALSMYHINKTTGETDFTRVFRLGELENAWVPIRDRGVHYGPWSNNDSLVIRAPLPGRAEVSIDRTLVPWAFGVRGMSHITAMEKLDKIAESKVDTPPKLSIINTGQLEVAGVPQTNLGQAIGLGASITEIFVRFDVNGITTRYIMNLYSRELGEFKRRQQEERESRKTKIEIDTDEECPDPDDAETHQIEDEHQAEDALEGGTAPPFERDEPKGGNGVIIGPSMGGLGGGAYYNVREASAADFGARFAMVIPLTKWSDVFNIAEPDGSPGYLPPGTRVEVKVWEDPQNKEGDVQVFFGPYYLYMEQSPQTFMPPT